MKKILFILFVLAVFVLTACGAPSARVPSTPAPVPAEYAGMTNPFGPESASAGAEVFAMNCVSCHGSGGRGDGPAGAGLDPAPRDLVELQALVGDDFLYWRINEGKEGTSMVPWKGILTEEQVWQLVAFIRTLK